jgi:nicotinamidase/pyrazinamidase
VNFTALDARQLGFKTTLIEDACRGVNIHPNDSAAAIEAMRREGVSVVSSASLIA